MKRIIIAALLCLCLIVSAASAETTGVRIVDSGLDLMECSVKYPQLAGMTNEPLQQRINQRIRQAGDIDALLVRLPMTMQSPTPLVATHETLLAGDVLSTVMTVSGPVKNERTTHIRRAAVIDLRTGEDVTFADLFTDAEAAAAFITDYLDYTLAPELSAHLMNSQLTPLPEHFAITPTGLTLYYPIDQLSTLSDRAGAVTLHWWELAEHLDLSGGSVLARIGAGAMLQADDTSAEKIRAAVESGSIPGIPVLLGSSVQEATDTYRMLTDPDLYQDGRMFALEDAAFRQVWLLTDSLTEEWDSSVIKGLRLDRINLYGLYTGMSEKAATAILGKPSATVTLKADAAEAYRLAPGKSLYYDYEGAQLRLHFADGTLASVMITKAD